MYNIKVLLLDVGGVLLSNGWDRVLREKVAQVFGFDSVEMSKRHELIFDFFERGKMSFDEYLQWTIFHEVRSFTKEEVKNYILNAARPFTHMIEYVKELKEERGLKIGILSNEGKEIGVDRIERFELGSFVDFFILSSFVKLRKPDREIYQLAIDMAQVKPCEICYIDDRPLLVELGRTLGMHAICHQEISKTKEELEMLLGKGAYARRHSKH